MNALVIRRAQISRFLFIAAFPMTMLAGCAMWPTNALKGSENEAALLTKALPSATGKCSDSDSNAMACANKALEMTHDLEVNAGSWDRGYSYLMLGLGTWGATALKSDSGHEQLLEDLAIAVGALAGLRAIVRPDEQRLIAQKGRTALHCALGAAQDLEQAKASMQMQSQSFAAEIDSVLFDAFATINGFASKSLNVNSNAPAHVAFAAGVAKSRAATVVLSAQRVRQAMDRESQNMRFALTEAVINILHDMASALSTPVAGMDDLAKTQRDSVMKLIGESANEIKQQRDETQTLQYYLGGVDGISMSTLTAFSEKISPADSTSGGTIEKRVNECVFDKSTS